MNAINPTEIFSDLCSLASEELDDRLPEKFQELQDKGLELKIKTSLEEPEFISDPSQYTEVIQYCKVWIGQSKVYEWEETYWGSYGGMGAGWWVELGDTSLESDVHNLLELLELLPEFPNVPWPDGAEKTDDVN
jgi:hypothetical protein